MLSRQHLPAGACEITNCIRQCCNVPAFVASWVEVVVSTGSVVNGPWVPCPAIVPVEQRVARSGAEQNRNRLQEHREACSKGA